MGEHIHVLGVANDHFSRTSRVWQSRFLAVMCVFLYEAGSESRFFARLRVSKSQFVVYRFELLVTL